jgi:hypothetical protein
MTLGRNKLRLTGLKNTLRASGKTGRTPRTDGYKSNGEKQYANYLTLLKAAGEVISWEYEPRKFEVGIGAIYTPDFIVHYPKRVEIIEIKGWSKNIRDGILRFKTAAMLYHKLDSKPIHWKMLTHDKLGWFVKYHFANGEKYKHPRTNKK